MENQEDKTVGKIKRWRAAILASVLKSMHQRRYGRDNRAKEKRDYVRLYRQKWEQRLAEEDGDPEAANEIFEDSVNAGEVAGYYIAVYGDEAPAFWKSNTRYRRLSGQDREVGKILGDLYGQDRGKSGRPA